jgi:biopolymer transport protein ExbB
MTRIFDTFQAGGLLMWPLLGLSVATFAHVLERSSFWFNLIADEKQVVDNVLAAAKVDLDKARAIAQNAENSAIGRFLAAPLKLKHPSAETFHLALIAAGDKEFVEMRKGDKLLESIIAIAPLLGILGTASGLFGTFNNLRNGKVDSRDVRAVTDGIGEALITSATGIAVAIIAFVFFQIFINLRSRQIDFFCKAGNELELIYLQIWHEPPITANTGGSGQNQNRESE